MSDIEKFDLGFDINFFGGEKKTYHDKVKFINQGTYGCIFRPAINCKGNLLKPSFITKIQSEKENSDKETKIGYKIKKIKGYSKYFAPILKTCNISIANIKNDEIKKCDFIDNKTTIIISNKMKYVGDKTLFDYFLSILEETPNKINDVMFDCYLHLLEGIELLQQNNIIHYDLKENNIVFDEQQNYPIIIDFGLSFENSNLHKYKYLTEAFYVYGPEYKPWCIEIHIICFILHNIDEKELDKQISLHYLNDVVDDFLKENTFFKYFKESEVFKHYGNTLKDFLKQYSELSYNDLISELIKYNYSWDNYSLAVIFLYFIVKLKSDSVKPLFKLLKEIIFTTPDARITIKETIERVTDIYDDNIEE
jgi:serine/threonine protein kinase